MEPAKSLVSNLVNEKTCEGQKPASSSCGQSINPTSLTIAIKTKELQPSSHQRPTTLGDTDSMVILFNSFFLLCFGKNNFYFFSLVPLRKEGKNWKN